MTDSDYSTITAFLQSALIEDIGDGDHTGLACIDADAKGRAVVKAKEPGVIAGLAVAREVLELVNKDLAVIMHAEEGDEVVAGTELMSIAGNVRNILKAERLLLNCLQRMSGIATKTRTLVNLVAGLNVKILDTRKTTPNFRIFEKWAVHKGGGYNHRFGLYDMILIKDNHVDGSGGIEIAIEKANQYLKQTGKDLKIEIETRNMDEVNQVLQFGNVNRIMLDNFSVAGLKEAVQIIAHRFETEASGNISESTIRAVAETGVDFISVGALTHSYKSLDISMKLKS